MILSWVLYPKDQMLLQGKSANLAATSRHALSGGAKLFGDGQPVRAARFSFGRAKNIPSHIPAVASMSARDTAFILSSDGDERRDPDLRGVRCAKVLPFRRPVPLGRQQ